MTCEPTPELLKMKHFDEMAEEWFDRANRLQSEAEAARENGRFYRDKAAKIGQKYSVVLNTEKEVVQ